MKRLIHDFRGECVDGDPDYMSPPTVEQTVQPALVIGGTVAALALLGGVAVAVAKARAQARPAPPAP